MLFNSVVTASRYDTLVMVVMAAVLVVVVAEAVINSLTASMRAEGCWPEQGRASDAMLSSNTEHQSGYMGGLCDRHHHKCVAQ